MFNCPNCGRSLPDDSVFCEGCGTPVSRYGAVQVDSAPKRNKSRSLLYIAAVVVVCVGVVLVYNFGLPALQSTAPGDGSSSAASANSDGSEAAEVVSSSASESVNGDSGDAGVLSDRSAFVGTYKLTGGSLTKDWNIDGKYVLYLAKNGKAKAVWGEKLQYDGSWDADDGATGKININEGTYELKLDGDSLTQATSDGGTYEYTKIASDTSGMPPDTSTNTSGNSNSSTGSSNGSNSPSRTEVKFGAYGEYVSSPKGSTYNNMLVVLTENNIAKCFETNSIPSTTDDVIGYWNGTALWDGTWENCSESSNGKYDVCITTPNAALYYKYDEKNGVYHQVDKDGSMIQKGNPDYILKCLVKDTFFLR